MNRRAGLDYIEPLPPTIGGAETLVGDEEVDDHTPHTFLYLPDLTMETGWSTHRVPDRVADREPERSGRPPMGFSRGGR